DVPNESDVEQQVRCFVVNEVAEWRGPNHVRDDVILVLVCFRGGPRHISNSIKLFDFTAAMAAQMSEPSPPTTTESGAPINAAREPASNSPSCGPPMKNIMLIDVMRPRRWFGVTSWRIVCRNTVLTVSAAPVIASINSESQYTVETPNPAVATPNTATDATTSLPCFRKLPTRAITRAVNTDPIAGAAARNP